MEHTSTHAIVDIAQSRKARGERSELFRNAGNDLLLLLESQRQVISEDFMTFLVALAVSDQALHYAQAAEDRDAGRQYLEHLFANALQLFEANNPDDMRPSRRRPQAPARIIDFCQAGKPAE